MQLKTEIVEIDIDALRALLFWASVGVHLSEGGQYQDSIEDILESYRGDFALPYEPRFKAARQYVREATK